MLAVDAFLSISLCATPTTFIRFPGGPHSVTSLGDLDGDGRAEVAIACGFRGKQLGRAALCSGKTGEVLRSWYGDATGHEFGSSVAACGDIDGDGKADLAIAAPGIGRVDLCSSRTGERLRRLLPPRDDGRFGEEVAFAGDVDGDGHGDLIVGAPESSCAYVFSGKDGKVLLALDNGGVGNFGRAVAGGGDLDGDGRPDVLVGASHEGQSGSVRAFSGRDGHRLWNDWSLGLAQKVQAGVGVSIAVLQDLSGDGACEVLVGADGVDSHGRALVVDGRSGSKRWSVEGIDTAFACFGSSVAALDDVDGDGVHDLAIADPDDSDAMSTGPDDFMPRGQAPGCVYVVSARTGLRLWLAAGDEEHDCLGYCVASAGDVDGDGVGDVIAMASNGGAWHLCEPYFRIYSGKDGRVIRELRLPKVGGAAVPK